MLKALATSLILGGIVFSGTVGAQVPDDQRPPLVTDYANYPGTPQARLTPGCDYTGVLNPTFGFQNITTGVQFGPVGDLSLLPDLNQGDLVRMAWTDVSPACIGSAVSFVVKVAQGPRFDPNVDQLTGPNGGYSVEFLVAGPGEITFPMPDLARFGLGCDYQLDAIVGVPLQDVGPSGSFFSNDLRVQQGKATADTRTTVISAKNGQYPVCTEVTTTTTAATTTTTTAPSTTTTPPTTVPPTTRTTVPFIVTQATPVLTAYVEYTPPRTPIAQTGFPMGKAVLLGVSAILIGLMLLTITKEKKRESSTPGPGPT